VRRAGDRRVAPQQTPAGKTPSCKPTAAITSTRSIR
jgi:hypothetical protein